GERLPAAPRPRWVRLWGGAPVVPRRLKRRVPEGQETGWRRLAPGRGPVLLQPGKHGPRGSVTDGEPVRPRLQGDARHPVGRQNDQVSNGRQLGPGFQMLLERRQALEVELVGKVFPLSVRLGRTAGEGRAGSGGEPV